MGQDKTASLKFVQTVPVRMTVDVYSTDPRVPKLGPDPVVVQVRGITDLNPDPTERTLPLWFDASVLIFEDRTAEILSFEPAYGSWHGARIEGTLISIYEHAFSRALVDTRLKILGVK